jgi:RND superfamily putative drug exporter
MISTSKPVVERVAGWSARHRIVVVIGWLLLVAVAFTVGQKVSQGNVQGYDPGQAGQAERVMNRPVVKQPAAETILVQARAAGHSYASDPQMRQAVTEVVGALRQLPRSATNIRSPLTSPGMTSGRSALVTFQIPDGAADSVVVPDLNAVSAVAARHRGLKVEEAGDASLSRAVGKSTGQDFRKAEVTSIPVTLALLLLVFGALIAAGIPLLLAGTAVISAISLLAVPGHWLPIDGTTSSIVLLVGMAVGIDYTLFYLRRVREERANGHTTRTALDTAARTSGKAIAVSGLTVMTSMAGLFLTGFDVFNGVAIATIMVVGIAVIGSLTFLPALLSLLGKATDRARIPFLGKRQAVARESRVWHAVVNRVVRRPLAWGGLTLAVLVALAGPLLGLKLQDAGIHDLPASVPVVRALLDIQQAFPGGPAPAEVVVTGDNVSSPAVRTAIAGLHAQVAATRGEIREPITTQAYGPAGPGQVLIVSVPLAGASGTDPGSMTALATLRDRALPATLGKVPGVTYAVGGLTAGNHDVDAQLAGSTPIVAAFIFALAFALIGVTFRSAVVPLISILLNVVSVGAAYGVMTWIFQDGHFQGLLGFSAYGGVTPWLPLFMFVLLFGLSMDYTVFILSRIRELRLRGEPARDAITGGIASSAGVVTSAAAIMVAVFSIFATLSIIEFKMFGITMAAAVLLDATVVRGILLPAALSLMGERLWKPSSPRYGVGANTMEEATMVR